MFDEDVDTQLRFDHSNDRESRKIGDLMARVYRWQLNPAIRPKLQTDLESRINTDDDRWLSIIAIIITTASLLYSR